jgi:hypothetical protein
MSKSHDSKSKIMCGLFHWVNEALETKKKDIE